jgi:hypothetical protein
MEANDLTKRITDPHGGSACGARKMHALRRLTGLDMLFNCPPAQVAFHGGSLALSSANGHRLFAKTASRGPTTPRPRTCERQRHRVDSH